MCLSVCLSVSECTGDDGVSPLVSASVYPSVRECTGDDGVSQLLGVSVFRCV